MARDTSAHGNPSETSETRAVRDVVLDVLLAAGSYTGAAFFQKLVEEVGRALRVDAAYICELTLDWEKPHFMLAGFNNLATGRPQHFGRGGACDAVVERGEVSVSSGFAQAFPGDDQLATLGCEGFVGAVLRSESSDPVGTICVMRRGTIEDARFVLEVLRSLAPRAAAEIERGQRALALQRSASRLRLLAERSKDVLFFYRLTPYPSMEFLSPAVESVFGYPVEAFHANPELLLQLVDDEDRPRLYEALSSGSEVPLITRVHRPDGGRRWVEYRDFPVRDREDHLIGIGGTIRDISASVEAEQSARESAEYVRALLDSIPDTLMLLHPDGTIRDYVIGEVELVEGPRSEVIGRQLREVVSMAAFAVLDRSVRAAVRTKRPQRMEFEMPGNDRRFLEVRSLPFVRGEVLLVLRDLTAKKWHETEEERHRLRDELDQRIERTTKTNPYALTYREMAVLHLVVEGMADKQIAEALGISIYTVNKHVGNILSKMNASSRTEASVRAVKEGFLRSDGESF